MGLSSDNVLSQLNGHTMFGHFTLVSVSSSAAIIGCV